ncbi:neuromodulin-like [Bufo bufo]|uniref:neuromodulin-like n=1 Tax=Bufo bufo TaxID=8384 RepID=UPI001ABED1CB|nr:neuromodulin-like [Bufo bufo]
MTSLYATRRDAQLAGRVADSKKMVRRTFSDREEKLLITRMVKKGYDRTRRHDSKKEIVRSIQQMLREKFAREHSESAIVKRWSDLKRRDPEFVREISERVCPGQPVPTVRSTPAHRDIHVVEVSEEEEEEAGPPTAMETSDTAPPDVAEHVEVEEEGGPSQPHTSPAAAIPPAEVTEEEEEQEVAAQTEEEEELVTTPQQEDSSFMSKSLWHLNELQGMKEKKI